MPAHQRIKQQARQQQENHRRDLRNIQVGLLHLPGRAPGRVAQAAHGDDLVCNICHHCHAQHHEKEGALRPAHLSGKLREVAILQIRVGGGDAALQQQDARKGIDSAKADDKQGRLIQNCAREGIGPGDAGYHVHDAEHQKDRGPQKHSR